MPKITPEIKEALVKLADDLGSATEISRKTGISHSTFSKYFSGQITKINQANWNLIAPLILPYLPEREREIAKSQISFKVINYEKNKPKDSAPPSVANTIRNTPELRECIKDAMLSQGIKNASELCRLVGYDCPHTLERLLSGKINWFPDMLSAVLDNLKISHDDAPMTPTERGILQPEGFYYNDGTQKTRAVLVHYQPVISWANAATYIDSMLNNNDGVLMKKWNPEDFEETVPVPLDIRGTCCIFRVSGQSMEPSINDGDILYCEQILDLKNIPDKRVVVVLFSDCTKFEDCIVCKRFRKIGEKILLTSDNPAGREFEVEPKDISWIGILRKLTKNGDSI